MRYALLLGLALFSLLGGCMGRASPADDSANAPSASRFSGARQADDGTVQDVQKPEGLEPATGACDLKATQIVWYQIEELGTAQCSFSSVRTPPPWNLENYRSASVHVTWSSLQPTITGVQAYVRAPGCAGADDPKCAIASAEGKQSPLRMTLDRALYDQWAGEHLFVIVFMDGLAVQQPLRAQIMVFGTDEPKAP